ncbi:Uncharacterised protein r2_g4234 [Pycnogonum litorale]
MKLGQITALFMTLLLTEVSVSVTFKVSDEKYDVVMPVSKSPLKIYRNAAIVAGAQECVEVGRSILEDKRGSAVDAAVAVGLCQGVVMPESMGLGGGHLAVIYDRARGLVETIDARHRAPQGATKDMYKGRYYKSLFTGLSTCVPGELLGYWEMHRKYGKLSWSELFDGAIEKAKYGFRIHEHYVYSMNIALQHVRNDPSSTIWDLFWNKNTGQWYRLGQVLKQPLLLKTLERLARNGAKEFYGGETGRKFVEDVRNIGGILTLDDLKNYSVRWRKPVSVTLRGGIKFYSVPPPGSGALVAFMLNIIDGYDKDELMKSNEYFDYFVLNEHRMLEAAKFAFAKRSMLGDEDYVNVSKIVSQLLSRTFADETRRKIDDDKTHEYQYYDNKYMSTDDHGTAHISVVDSYGNAVSLTSTIDLYFGSKSRSLSTGIIIANTMNDFSFPNVANADGLKPSGANFIKAGKRPMSSTSPSIFLDRSGNVRLVIGGAGGTRITTGVTSVSAKHLWMNQDVKKAIDSLRLHHQLIPDVICYEHDYPKKVLERLRSMGHQTEERIGILSVIQAISRDNYGKLYANSDHRKGGSASGF